ncbi:MAG: 3-keto-5-aminohexanoate cleavage protein [Lachnospiraceae bacterium]|nr:3-keto-5-aminohexanoate cleavage protein [Lachnospiraceae bacterium]
MRKVIISLAPVAGPSPVDPDRLAEDVVKSVQKGAAMCHLHCKKRTGELTPDTCVIIESFEKICAKCDVVVQASTGGISNMTIEERCNPLEYWRVESASLNGGSTNLGEAVYRNSFDDIRYCARQCYEREILPETEVFDIGMINNVEMVAKEQPFREPVLYNLVFGHKGGMQPTMEALAAFRSFVPEGRLWGVTHFGRDNWTFLAAAIAMGATVVRIGFEDSPYLDEQTNAQYNYQVVEKLVQLIRAMGLEPATPAEARQILNLAPKSKNGAAPSKCNTAAGCGGTCGGNCKCHSHDTKKQTGMIDIESIVRQVMAELK